MYRQTPVWRRTPRTPGALSSLTFGPAFVTDLVNRRHTTTVLAALAATAIAVLNAVLIVMAISADWPGRDVVDRLWSPLMHLGVIGAIWATAYAAAQHFTPMAKIPVVARTRVRRTRAALPYVAAASVQLLIISAVMKLAT